MEKFRALTVEQKLVQVAMFKHVIENLDFSKMSEQKLKSCKAKLVGLNEQLSEETRVSDELVFAILHKKGQPTDEQMALTAYAFLSMLLPEQFGRQNWTVQGFVTFVFEDLLKEQDAPSFEELVRVTEILLQ